MRVEWDLSDFALDLAKSLKSHSTRIRNRPESLSWCWSAWRIFALWLYRKLAIVATNPLVSGQSINNTALDIEPCITLIEVREAVNITVCDDCCTAWSFNA